MTPSEIRTELLTQHAELRAMIRRAASIVAALRRGEPARTELAAALGALAVATHGHNDHEEALLGGIIPTVDAWGPARASVMDAEHRLEHRELQAAFLTNLTGDDESVCRAVDELLGRLVEHMEREEDAFLSEEVLRDDGVITSYFGG